MPVTKLPEKWSEDFNTGVKFIDEQHQYYFSVVKDLESAINEGICEEKISEIFFRIVHYIEHYTIQEEIYFKDTGFEKLDSHKQAHKQFLNGIIKFKDEYQTKSKNVCLNLYEFLTNWFEDHILGLDVITINQLRKAGI